MTILDQVFKAPALKVSLRDTVLTWSASPRSPTDTAAEVTFFRLKSTTRSSSQTSVQWPPSYPPCLPWFLCFSMNQSSLTTFLWSVNGSLQIMSVSSLIILFIVLVVSRLHSCHWLLHLRFCLPIGRNALRKDSTQVHHMHGLYLLCFEFVPLGSLKDLAFPWVRYY